MKSFHAREFLSDEIKLLGLMDIIVNFEEKDCVNYSYFGYVCNEEKCGL